MSVPVLLWVVMGVAVAALFLWRKHVEQTSDELVHLSDVSGAEIQKQEAAAKQLTSLDRMMKVALAVTVIYGLAIGCFYIYDALMNGGKLS